jgi:hypothetical protein
MGLFPTLFGSMILILFSYIVFTPKAANVTISVSPDFKMKHIRQGNCNVEKGVVVDGNVTELFKDNLNRTAMESKDFRYTSKKKIKINGTYSRKERTLNTFIMTDIGTVDDISNCIETITLKKQNEWTKGKFENTSDLIIKKDYVFSLCPKFKVEKKAQMYLAVMNITWYQLSNDLNVNCSCYSDDFDISISLKAEVKNKTKTGKYIINHFSNQKVSEEPKPKICH